MTSDSRLEIGSKIVKEYEDKTSQLIKDLKVFDVERAIMWYLTNVGIAGSGFLYPEGETKDNWRWAVASVVKLTEEERKQYPVPGKKNEYYESRLAVETSKKFDKKCFREASLYLVSLTGK